MGNEILQNTSPEAQKKEKRNSIIITVCVILAAALIIGLTVFNRLTDTGYFLRSETAAQSENFEVDGAMMTYFFHSNYQSYASYASYLGFDTSISLKAQECSLYQSGSGYTWFDYFASLAQSYVNELLALCEAAHANGVTLDDADKASIDASIDNLTAMSEMYGYSLNQYLITAFGAAINGDDVKNCLELTALASKYSTQYMASLNYSDEQLEAYYDANKANFEGVDVIAITIPSSTYQETDADGNPVGDATSSSAAAEAKANEMAASSSADEFNAAIRDFLVNDRGNAEADVDAMVEQCYSAHVTAATLGSAAEWAFSASVGDTYVSGGAGASQYTVYYLAKTAYRNDTPGRNIRHILFTNTTYADDTAVNEVYAEWEAAGFTEEKFLELNNLYNEDSSITNGGLYENVQEGQMVTEFNDWMFDSSRKTGDHGIVETTYGWHIMYYAGESEYAAWQAEALGALQQNDYTKMVEQYAAGNTFNNNAMYMINA
ncbi:MAG: peptidylprolyl isomerase [Clostridia bacterium]|nr:peptidylprolyl isomerase [Clostridia bacterium]